MLPALNFNPNGCSIMCRIRNDFQVDFRNKLCLQTERNRIGIPSHLVFEFGRNGTFFPFDLKQWHRRDNFRDDYFINSHPFRSDRGKAFAENEKTPLPSKYAKSALSLHKTNSAYKLSFCYSTHSLTLI
jgi:hypothetical protein